MTRFERQLDLPEQLSSVTRARHFVRDVLLECELEGLVEDAELGTTELVANAVRHARTALMLSIRVDEMVTISIRDGRPELRRPLLGESDTLAENGRGLHIVAAISRDWGITTAADGKVVWFVLARPDQGGVDADVLSMEARRSRGSLPGSAGPGVGDYSEHRRRERVESPG